MTQPPLEIPSVTVEAVTGSYIDPAIVNLLFENRYALFVAIFSVPLLSLLYAFRSDRTNNPAVQCAAGSWAFSAFLSAFICHLMPDEVFMNLLQSTNLAEWGRYSFHREANVDGSAALLPYLLVALFHAIGINAPLGAILLTAASTAATVWLLASWAGSKSNPCIAWLIGLSVTLNPDLLILSGSGWSAPFLGMLVALSIVLWEKARYRSVLLILIIVAFVRWESSFYSVGVAFLLYLLSQFSREPEKRLSFRESACVLIGPVLFYSWWTHYYGYFFPSCVEMKTGGGLPFFLHAFPESFIELSKNLFPFVAVTLLTLRYIRFNSSIPIIAWLLPAIVHYLGVSWGGGDYMPGHRYQIALIIAVMAASIVGLGDCYAALQRTTDVTGKHFARIRFITLPLAILLFAYYSQPLDTLRRVQDSGMPVETLPFNNTSGIGGMRGSRLTRHYATGEFFSWLTDRDTSARLATLEVASAYYSFTGVPIDAQGFANRSVARGPKNPALAFSGTNRIPSTFEAVWAKRLDVGVWQRENPDIVWIDTKVARGQYAERWRSSSLRSKFNAEDPDVRYKAVVHATSHRWTAEYLRADYLWANYQVRLTEVNNSYLILWLVRNDLAEQFDEKLSSAAHDAHR